MELLTSLRSHRCSSDADLIRQGEPASRLRARTSEGDLLELELRRRGGRRALRNGRTLERQIDLIGPLRCVGFSALDLDLVRGNRPSAASGSTGWCCSLNPSTAPS